MTTLSVVDTNVDMVANDDPNDGARSPECVLACTRFLTEIMRSGSIAIDSGREIIREYMNMQSVGQPRIGNAFLKWVLTNQANPDRCHQADIRTVTMPEQLADFDSDDHKFIKTAVATPGSRIAEAVDSLWWKRREDFVAAGIPVDYLCQRDIKAFSDGKHGPDA